MTEGSDQKPRPVAPEEHVRVWRPPDVRHVLLMHSIMHSAYATDPDGEYIVGLVLRRGLHVQRGRDRYQLQPGDLGIWDPGQAHAGSPRDDGAWDCRLLIIELPDLNEIVRDVDHPLPDLTFPDPVIRDPRFGARFLELHKAMEAPASTLERESLLASWLQELAGRSPVLPRRSAQRLSARDDPAVRRACARMLDDLTSTVTLAELALAAGVSQFRLVRLFQAAFGAPPHAFQIAQQVKRARRLLERGYSPAQAAAAVGFYDQSHLHRHFTRRTGMTPGAYAAAVSGRF